MSDRSLTPVALDLDAGRRAFLRAAGLTGAGLAAIGLGAAGAPGPAEAAPLNDANILNFALNLEYLEAEYYLRAARGTGLADRDVGGRGSVGKVVGGTKVPFADKTIREYAEEIAEDELAHVRLLRAGLGAAAVARPRIDLKGSFTAAARAAGIVGPGDSFDPFSGDDAFLLGAFIFEDVGVTAYKGAARFIENKDFLEAAAGLLAVEAYHAGEIRTILYGRGLLAPARAISRLRGSVGGGKDQPIARDGKANIIPTDQNGLAFSRSPAEVLAIVYLGGGKDGGFYPQGLNGAISRV